MIGRLVAALGRRSRTTRRLRLAALGLVVLLVVASALAPARHPAHGPVAPPTVPTRTQRTPTGAGSRPISPAGLVAARRVADRFLAGYLPSVYGRGPARSIEAVTPGLRLELGRMRGLVTPVERQRHACVISLTAVAQSPAAMLVTALAADGGVTTYALRIMLSAGRGGWMVSSGEPGVSRSIKAAARRPSAASPRPACALSGRSSRPTGRGEIAE
jgi:hypothetical protein